ncbi:MAG: PorT family protein [Chitinophagaceae bacterium]|nr:MAG: PorT family protein [Chitinophagaceae bacterium]
MLYLLRTKSPLIRIITCLAVFLFSFHSAFAQEPRELNLYDHDYKPYYFGITLGLNSARFHPQMHSQFIQNDSVLVAEPTSRMGFSLGLSATARLSNRFQLRFNPNLSFMERDIVYQLKFPEDNLTEVTKKVESVLVSFPVQVKLQSDRIGNFRVYMLAGLKADIDLSSNARAKRAEELIKIKSFDYGPEVGLGFNFFFQSFIFSPELKFSNGIPNLHSRDANLKYSSVFDKVQSRSIIFTIHIEG